MVVYAPWDIRVTLDLFLGGLGVGVFLLSVMLSYYDKNRYSQLIKMGAYLAPVLVGLGLLFLISELGKPMRAMSMMYNFNPSSVLSWGGLFQGVFMALSLYYAAMLYKGSDTDSLKGVALVGALFAIAVGVYHGLLLTSIGRPLWAGGMISALFLASSLLGGAAVLLLVNSLTVSAAVPSAVRNQVAAAGDVKGFNFSIWIFGLSAIQLILVITWQISLYRAGLDALQAVNGMMAEYGAVWIGLFIIAGLVVPLIGSLMQLLKGGNAEMSKGMALGLSVLTIIGSFTFKYIVLSAGQLNAPFFLN